MYIRAGVLMFFPLKPVPVNIHVKCLMLHLSFQVFVLLSPPCGLRYETTSSDDSSSEDSSSSGSDEEEQDEEKEYGEREEYKNVEGKSTREEFEPEGAEDVDKKDGEEVSEKQEMRERWVKENSY